MEQQTPCPNCGAGFLERVYCAAPESIDDRGQELDEFLEQFDRPESGEPGRDTRRIRKPDQRYMACSNNCGYTTS